MSVLRAHEILDLAATVEARSTPPGRGGTARRWGELAAVARHHDTGRARLVEAHVDATAILAEAGRPARPGLYGVWASAGEVSYADGRLRGRKPFCSGVGVCDRALVTVDAPDGPRLVDVAVRTVRAGAASWAGTALATTATMTAHFDDTPVDELVGPPHWYLDRIGFWHGALGPAACWAGSAQGLLDTLDDLEVTDPHQQAARGGARAAAWSMHAALDRAGRLADDRPEDRDAARYAALAARHLVADACRQVLDRADRGFGPRLRRDDRVVQRIEDLRFYVLQHHGERDLAMLGSEPRADGPRSRPVTDPTPTGASSPSRSTTHRPNPNPPR